MSVKKVNDNELNNYLNKGIVLLDFFADWCGPCKMLSPVIEQVSNEMDDVTFLKINIDENNKTANLYKVMSIPTLILFKDGKLISKSVGFLNKEELKKFIISNK